MLNWYFGHNANGLQNSSLSETLQLMRIYTRLCFQKTLSDSDRRIWHFHRFTGWCEGLEGTRSLVHPPGKCRYNQSRLCSVCEKDSHSFSYKLPFQFMHMISETKTNKPTNLFFPCRASPQLKFITVVWTRPVWTAGTNLDLLVLYQVLNVEILLYLSVLVFFFCFIRAFS